LITFKIFIKSSFSFFNVISANNDQTSFFSNIFIQIIFIQVTSL